jgi:hypothetical protein
LLCIERLFEVRERARERRRWEKVSERRKGREDDDERLRPVKVNIYA